MRHILIEYRSAKSEHEENKRHRETELTNLKFTFKDSN